MAYDTGHLPNLGHLKASLLRSHGEVADIAEYILKLSENIVAGNVREFYAVCTTKAATQGKEISIDGLESLLANDIFHITFTNAQTYNGAPTLNINGMGANNIQRVTGTNAGRYEWNAGETLCLVWNGTYFLIAAGGFATTTYYGRTKLSSATNSTSEAMAATPKAVKTAYDLAAAIPGYTVAQLKAL